ncbi:MAG TPA: hypothetical protein VEQ11_05235 [Chloroflexota bacterium]|nr:hypothetical protein [Chloroflexota bacterium]
MIGRGSMVFGAVRQLWEGIREVNPDEVRGALERPFLIGLFGRLGSGRATLARALFGEDPSRGLAPELKVAGLETGVVQRVGRPDLALLLVDASQPDWSNERRTAREIGALGVPMLLILTHADLLPQADQASRAAATQFPDQPPELTVVVDPRDCLAVRLCLVGLILQTVHQLRLALAHRFPCLRRAVAEDLVRETSRVNAQFALVSNLPALVPVVGAVVGGMADALILTKNQAVLVYKLAGIYGRDLNDGMSILQEIAPVIGGAFVWRSLARTAVGALPPFAAALPKTAIAYVGTYVVGEAARYYYEHDHKPPPAILRSFQKEALRRYRGLNDLITGRLSSE